MTCIHCGYEGPKTSFRYLYNVRLEESAANRECPKCFGWVMVDERTGEISRLGKDVHYRPLGWVG